MNGLPVDVEVLLALKDAKRLLDRFANAVEGNDQLQGCEEFYRGYNAVTRRVAIESRGALKSIDAALAKAEGRQ